jgi:hypothetical protein
MKGVLEIVFNGAEKSRQRRRRYWDSETYVS